MIEGIIYRYISPSGKSYIGQTTNEVYRRRMWFGKGRYTGGRSKIDRARKKYNFMYEVLLRNQYSGIEAATLDLNKWETYYIGYYDTYKNGYNSTLGSRVSSSLKGIAKSVEHRKKLSESKKNSGHKILQYSLTGEYIKTWDNIDEVAKTLGVSRESIAGCCRGKSKTAHKFIWKYK